MTDDPYARGTWTGRVVSVRVADQWEVEYDATALQIETGPRTLKSSGRVHGLADEDAPYLSPVGVAVVRPAELGVRPGDRVRVRGKMIAAGVGVSWVGSFRSIKRKRGEPPGDPFVIQLRGKPEVLEAATDGGGEGQAGVSRATEERHAASDRHRDCKAGAQRKGTGAAAGADRAGGPERLGLATPSAAVRAYAEAWRDGDAEKFMACAYAANDKERKGLDLYARWIASSSRLERAAEKAYGAAGAQRVREAVPLPLPSPAAYGRQILAQLEDLQDDDVTVEGDRASVSVEAAGALKLRRVGKRWKVVLIAEDEAAAAGAAGPDNTPVWNAAIQGQEAVAAGVSAGDFKTADDAAEALRAKIEAALGDEEGGADNTENGEDEARE